MTRKHVRRAGLALLGLTILLPLAAAQVGTEGGPPAPPPGTAAPAAAQTAGGYPAAQPAQPTADHSRFEVLQHDFKSGPEVTAACLTCHTEASKQIMKTSHWTWICPRAKKKLEEEQHIAVGKAEHIINNFCIALPSNEPRCTSCHAGYGWKDKSFDFGDETLVDCLICHDQTGTYKKFPTAAGHPAYEPKEWPKGSGQTWPAVDLNLVARNVGRPTRSNCGTCHFFGGGGEGVKHGDMDVTLAHPDRMLDVHMGEDGPDFDCMQCHTTREHAIAGRCFDVPAYDDRQFVLRGMETNLLACESCHTTTPHPVAGQIRVGAVMRDLTWAEVSRNKKLNNHADKVSCQACHIPHIAPRKATKMWWDWSKAGRKTEDGKPIVTKQAILPEGVDKADATEVQKANKENVYDTKKGEFIWAMKAVPEYIWYDGSIKHTFMGDKIDDSTPHGEVCPQAHGRYDLMDESKPAVMINRVLVGYDDPKARIWPAKIMRGIQPYDPENKTLVIPKLFPGDGPDKGEAYWKAYDWQRSIVAGMEYAGLPYSGEYDWIQTEMIWPLKHMVGPKETALTCNECHAPQGRLASLTGFYMPGRDSSSIIDIIGIIVIIAAIAVSLLHGVLRVFLGSKG